MGRPQGTGGTPGAGTDSVRDGSDRFADLVGVSSCRREDPDPWCATHRIPWPHDSGARCGHAVQLLDAAMRGYTLGVSEMEQQS